MFNEKTALPATDFTMYLIFVTKNKNDNSLQVYAPDGLVAFAVVTGDKRFVFMKSRDSYDEKMSFKEWFSTPTIFVSDGEWSYSETLFPNSYDLSGGFIS